MKKYTIFGEVFKAKVSFPLKVKIDPKDLLQIDLSVYNPDLEKADISDEAGLHSFIFGEIAKHGVKGAYGGYGEKRNLYERSEVFNTGSGQFRNIHLGIDFWFPAGTEVSAILPGRIHSFADNANPGDYGPTLILEHHFGNEHIYSLYGHLSRSSLENIHKGKMISRGEVIGTLGKAEENLGWPPHLHFQLIYDLGGMEGDYPGVCHEAEKASYLENCPNPIRFLGGLKHMLD
jgi:murein DD-endopeptidase MepM/ murein hydrolase activator NlpD